jgi:hypothetical protein
MNRWMWLVHSQSVRHVWQPTLKNSTAAAQYLQAPAGDTVAAHGHAALCTHLLKL